MKFSNFSESRPEGARSLSDGGPTLSVMRRIIESPRPVTPGRVRGDELDVNLKFQMTRYSDVGFTGPGPSLTATQLDPGMMLPIPCLRHDATNKLEWYPAINGRHFRSGEFKFETVSETLAS